MITQEQMNAQARMNAQQNANPPTPEAMSAVLGIYGSRPKPVPWTYLEIDAPPGLRNHIRTHINRNEFLYGSNRMQHTEERYGLFNGRSYFVVKGDEEVMRILRSDISRFVEVYE